MKLPILLLALLIAICAVLTVALVIGEMPDGHGVTHPEFPTMLQGPSGIQRHSPIILLGLAFGVLQLCFFVALMALAVKKQNRLRIFKTPLLIGLLLSVAAFAIMMYSYWIFAQKGDAPFIGSFPRPTAMMFYVLWPVLLVFVCIYIGRFDRAIFTEEDQQKFDRIIEARRKSQEETTDGS